MNEETLKLVKQALSIAESSNLKDEEIKMLIEAGIEDLNRLKIKKDLNSKLYCNAIILYVKANFGNVEIKEKERSEKAYDKICAKLSLSKERIEGN
jgi:hypothetical protein